MIYSINMNYPCGSFNLGNQLFAIASLLGMAKRYKTSLLLQKEWEYNDSFNLKDVVRTTRETNVFLREPAFSCSLGFFDMFAEIFKREVVGIEGFLQTELYWKEFESDIRRNLSFNEELRTAMCDILNFCEIDTNHFVAISVRRGDFVKDLNHYLLPRDYYANAYKKFFDGYGVFFFSDDIRWCRENLSDISDRAFFADGLNSCQQMCLMSLFEKFIIANSTFSWWGAYLSKASNKIVIRPFHHFDGTLRTTNITDHYPKDWIGFDHKK